MIAEMSVMRNILHNSAKRSDVLVHVAVNVRRLRAAAGLNQTALASAAEVSRRTLVNIEKGDVNVSLNTLDRLAAALGVAFYALIAPPEIEDTARIDEVAWAGTNAGSQARLLASKAAGQEVELWLWSMAPGEIYASEADPRGWTNMIVVIAGELTVTLGQASCQESGQESNQISFTVAAGDFRVFPSDQPHQYANYGDDLLRFVRNVVY